MLEKDEEFERRLRLKDVELERVRGILKTFDENLTQLKCDNNKKKKEKIKQTSQKMLKNYEKMETPVKKIIEIQEQKENVLQIIEYRPTLKENNLNLSALFKESSRWVSEYDI